MIKMPESYKRLRDWVSEWQDKYMYNPGSFSEEEIQHYKDVDHVCHILWEQMMEQSVKPKKTTKISKKDGEYCVKLYIDNAHQPEADYFTTDQEDAVNTARHMREEG